MMMGEFFNFKQTPPPTRVGEPAQWSVKILSSSEQKRNEFGTASSPPQTKRRVFRALRAQEARCGSTFHDGPSE
jgi:hypothetical protein